MGRHPKGRNMAVSVLFRIDRSGHIEVLDDGPPPHVVVDADGQLHAESGIITLLQVLRRVAHGFTNYDNYAARGILVTS